MNNSKNKTKGEEIKSNEVNLTKRNFTYYNKIHTECSNCTKSFSRGKMFKCFSCGVYKCQDCYSLEKAKIKKNSKGESYICLICFWGSSKNR